MDGSRSFLRAFTETMASQAPGLGLQGKTVRELVNHVHSEICWECGIRVRVGEFAVSDFQQIRLEKLHTGC